MAARQPRPAPTVKERQQMDRVTRARKSYPRFDRHGGYRDACGELARETGAEPCAVYEEWEHITQTRLYEGEIEVEDAERLALEDVRSAFRRAS